MKDPIYKRISCPQCHGKGVINSWVGECYKCKGEGYIYIEVKK